MCILHTVFWEGGGEKNEKQLVMAMKEDHVRKMWREAGEMPQLLVSQQSDRPYLPLHSVRTRQLSDGVHLS